MSSQVITAPLARTLAAALILTSAGCASVSPELARTQSRGHAAEHVGPAATIEAAAHRQRLLAAPLDRDSAVALALAFNPQMRITWSRLGIGAADAFEASRLANPSLSFARRSGSEGVQRSRSLGLNVAGVLLLPHSRRLARLDFEALQLEVAARIVDTARETEAAWYRHVAAEQAAALAEAVAEAAGASAELAERFHTAGNISRLALVRERAAAGEARVAALQARAAALATRTELSAQMGLGGEDTQRWRAPTTLPLPPADEPALDALLVQAQNNRLDLVAARLQVELLADAKLVGRRWRWLGALELDYEWEREPDGARMRGPELSLELPVFQQGQAGLLRAEARLQRGEAELAERALAVELGVIEAHGRLLGQRAIIETYASSIVPDRAEAVSRELERYNFMLIGAFELLSAKQSEFQAYAGWIEAVRDYWLARTDLAHAAGSALPAEPADGAHTPELQPLIRPGGSGHEQHQNGNAAADDPHAAHRAAAAAEAKAADPHAHHRTPAAPADPHAAHRRAAEADAPAPDPHAAHRRAAEAAAAETDAEAAKTNADADADAKPEAKHDDPHRHHHATPEAERDPHAGHEQHPQHPNRSEGDRA
ncbi:TolC family protein [Aquimonas sp.]|jgi:cobalt-zinc-cadmium efflux system outer membrane protein|uniref:TolC family protein n=1 Tax=Aquimonas sp. TaxID=1872588 RepID=UPI0037BE5076